MDDANRGKIIDKERKQQILDYSGIRIGNSTPTDIDGMIEYKCKGYIFIEVKYGDKKLPEGQEKGFTRLVDDLYRANKKAVLLIVEHYIHDTNIEIPVADCYVREFYFEGKWRKPKKSIKAKDEIDNFISHLNG